MRAACKSAWRTLGCCETVFAKGAWIEDIKHFMNHADRQIDQTIRKVLQSGIISPVEKVVSIFELHTKWICKGKI